MLFVRFASAAARSRAQRLARLNPNLYIFIPAWMGSGVTISVELYHKLGPDSFLSVESD